MGQGGDMEVVDLVGAAQVIQGKGVGDCLDRIRPMRGDQIGDRILRDESPPCWLIHVAWLGQ